MEGYCEKHHQPCDIKNVNGKWVCECPKCRAEGLLDTYYDCKTTMLKEKEWTASNHIKSDQGPCLYGIMLIWGG